MNKNKQTPRLVWFTGLSGAGKTTLANALNRKLTELGFSSYVLDGDNIRCGINRDLSFSPEDRSENIRRIIEIASLFLDAGIIVITAFISPYEKDRQKAKDKIGKANFLEVYLSTPLDVCEARDVKNLYKKARAGEITDFTGINAPYEVPISADIEINTSNLSIEKSVDKILKHVFKQ